MTLKTKLVFEEKTLMTEILNDLYFQVLEFEDELCFLLISELELDLNKKIECNISRKEGMVSFNNIGNNIQKLTDVSFLDLINETPEPSGSVINYTVERDDIKDLEKLIKTEKKIKVIHFIVDDIEKIENLMEEKSYEMGDGDDYLDELINEEKCYGINKKTKDSFSKIAYDICSEKGWITPFYFIEDFKDIKSIEEVKLPENIRLNIFNI